MPRASIRRTTLWTFKLIGVVTGLLQKYLIRDSCEWHGVEYEPSYSIKRLRISGHDENVSHYDLNYRYSFLKSPQDVYSSSYIQFNT